MYSTYLGGNGDDEANGLALDAIGDAHIVGMSSGNGFPVGNNAIQLKEGGFSDAFVFKISLSKK